MTPERPVTIYDFIDNPFRAVKAGYRPCYLSCVSAVSHHWWTSIKNTADTYAEFCDILDMTLKEIFVTLLHCVTTTILTATFPISMWFLAWIQYANIQHTLAGLRS